MRIRILQPTWLPGQVHPIAPGTELDLPDAQAADIIAHGGAEAVSPPAPPPPAG